MSTIPTPGPSGAAAFFAKLEPGIRGDSVGASLGDVWMPGAAWDGVAALFAAADDTHAQRGLTVFLCELADQIHDTVWQEFVLQIVRELEKLGEPSSSATEPS